MWERQFTKLCFATQAGRAFAAVPRFPARVTALALVAVTTLGLMTAVRLWSQTFDAFGGDQPLEWAQAQVILFETPWGGGWRWQAGATMAGCRGCRCG